MQAIPKFIFGFFLIVPFIEIFLLLQVGGIIGVLPTILLVVFTAFLGVNLLRQQGLATWTKLQRNMQQGVMPTNELVEGVFILLGGALLLTPGFFTDIMGFACLIPVIRHKIAAYALQHFFALQVNKGQNSSPFSRSESNVLEGEYRKED